MPWSRRTWKSSAIGCAASQEARARHFNGRTELTAAARIRLTRGFVPTFSRSPQAGRCRNPPAFAVDIDHGGQSLAGQVHHFPAGGGVRDDIQGFVGNSAFLQPFLGFVTPTAIGFDEQSNVSRFHDHVECQAPLPQVSNARPGNGHHVPGARILEPELRDFQQLSILHRRLMRDDSARGHIQSPDHVDERLPVLENGRDKLVHQVAMRAAMPSGFDPRRKSGAI